MDTAQEKKLQRVLYKAYRCAHDGICPQCGGKTWGEGRYIMCHGGCDFRMTAKEIEFALAGLVDFQGDVKEALARLREHLN